MADIVPHLPLGNKWIYKTFFVRIVLRTFCAVTFVLLPGYPLAGLRTLQAWGFQAIYYNTMILFTGDFLNYLGAKKFVLVGRMP